MNFTAMYMITAPDFEPAPTWSITWRDDELMQRLEAFEKRIAALEAAQSKPKSRKAKKSSKR